MTKLKIYLQKSSNKKKKYMATIVQDDCRNKTVHFGAAGYSDYTKHKDKERLARYNKRHKPRENWTKSGIKTAGFWAKWILWNKPTLSGSINHTASKFKIKIIRGKPPLCKK